MRNSQSKHLNKVANKLDKLQQKNEELEKIKMKKNIFKTFK